ncbi:MAG: hypothetical protein ACAI43_03415 [Phycisphaerae bacterium]|nr:hypothetical protein [Tepidisphaeraceae bacterium]
MPAPRLDYRPSSPVVEPRLRRRPRGYPLWAGVVVTVVTPVHGVLLLVALERLWDRGTHVWLAATLTFGVVAVAAWANFALLARSTHPRLATAGPRIVCALAMVACSLTASVATLLAVAAPLTRFAG